MTNSNLKMESRSRMQINKIEIIDCIEGMKKLENDSVHISITSPPYNVGNSVRGNLYNEYNDSLTPEQYKKFIYSVIDELIRVTKHYVFFNFQILSNNKNVYLDMLSDYKHNIKDTIIWHKKQVQPSIDQHILNSAFEFIIVFSKKEFCEKRSFERCFFDNRKKGQLNNNVIYGNNSANERFNGRDEHGAIFPVYLVKEILKRFSQENDLILDPFMGTGTTAVSSRQLNRNYIGFEINERYYNIAKQRLSQKNINEMFAQQNIKDIL